MNHRLFPVFVFVLISHLCHAQLTINEVCSSNNSVILDEDGDSRDWIEFFNASNSPINLGGYYLSDNKSDTTKWQFQGGSVPAQGFAIVFASGKDRPTASPAHTSFRLSQDGETVWFYDPQKNLVDSMSVPFISTDRSYGTYPDGASDRAFFATPTPDASNNTSTPSDHIIAFRPTFSYSTGIYHSEFKVEINSIEADATIRFTLDGSEPNSSSPIYTEAIDISSSTALNARVFKDGLLPSRNAVVNYIFIEEQTIPIVCLSTHPGYFFDTDTGIYVLGPNAEEEFPYYGANFWSDTEIPVNVQWIDEYGQLGFEQKLGVRIHGGSVSRTRPMRSLRLLADDKYGDDDVNYSLFTTKIQPKNKRFLLRNSGSDYLKTMLRDGFIHNHFINSSLHVDAISYNPVDVYLNGDYWGIHNVREKVDRYYIQYNFGVDDDNVDMLEEQDLIMEGTFDAFDAMEATLLSLDLTSDTNFEIADSLFDVLNMADYFICQTYINNLDWPYNNLKYWRERRVGAKWRYIIFDLDATLGGVSFAPVDFDNLERALGEFGDDNRHIIIFRKLLDNQNYRNYFINRYCDLVNTSLSASEFSEAARKAAKKIEPEIDHHFNRWSPELNDWAEQVDIVTEYIETRPPYAINYLQDFFELEKRSALHLNVFPPKAGKIALNSISVRNFPFDGVYFEDVPIELATTANPGFTFSHWESNRSDLNVHSTGHSFLPTDGDSLTAVFVGNATYSPLDVFPNPTTTATTVRFNLNRKQMAGIYLSDLNGQVKFQLFEQQLFAGTHELNLEIPEKLEGVYLLTVLTEDDRYTEKLMLIKQD